jgi:aryl-alcohol dehydrogenase-like predicted oxidoreductase
MLTRKLGHSDVDVSAMGLGCYAIGGPFKIESGKHWGWGNVEDSESIRAIHAGLDMGINFLDTANVYGAGHSEVVIGKALAGRRDEVIIATKFGNLPDEDAGMVTGASVAPDSIRQSCEDSLRRLDSDYIDLFQFHKHGWDVNEVPAILDVLDDLVTDGKIRWYGWSTDDPERARLFAQRPGCVAIQHRLHVFEDPAQSGEMLALCDEFDLASINRGPLLMGILTGKFRADSSFPENDVRHSLGFSFREGRMADLLARAEAIQDLLTSDGRTVAQGALAWIWARSQRTIPIPGFKTVDQVVENAGAMSFGPLKQAVMRQIDEILGRAITEEGL